MLLGAPYWAVFLGTPDRETMFVGLYDASYREVLTRDAPMPHRVGEFDRAGTCDVYELTLSPRLRDYIGKLFIDWGKGTRSWIQYADRREKTILRSAQDV